MENNDAFQIILGSSLGDGHISKKQEFSTGSRFKEYVFFKQSFLTNLCSKNWYSFLEDNPFNGEKSAKKYEYHRLYLPKNNITVAISNLSLESKLEKLSELGLAIWFYDDCSLHKTKHFYNLGTHKFTEKEHKRVLIPFFEKLGLHPKLAIENKKNGNKYFYLRFNKITGNVNKISRILNKFYVSCYSYKILPN